MVPIPWIDMLAAFGTNLQMIRRIGEIYGGRSGPIGSWRLLRSVSTHLMATGALAVGDDWLGSVFGGSLLSRLSRRFGEGPGLVERVFSTHPPIPKRVERLSQIGRGF